DNRSVVSERGRDGGNRLSVDLFGPRHRLDDLSRDLLLRPSAREQVRRRTPKGVNRAPLECGVVVSHAFGRVVVVGGEGGGNVFVELRHGGLQLWFLASVLLSTEYAN